MESAMKAFLATVTATLISLSPAAATEFRFATPAEAAAILITEDDFLTRLRPAEIGVRMMSADKTSLSDLKAQYAASTLAWTDEEKAFWSQVFDRYASAIDKYTPLTTREIIFIKGDDRIDSGMPHTRGDAIIFSQNFLDGLAKSNNRDEDAAYFFLHEYFHVLTRRQADRHDEMFALIGYRPCAFKAPAELDALHLTNPDAPVDRHYVPADIEGADGVIPYLYVDKGGWSAEKGGGLNKYFNFGLLAVDVKNGACSADLDASGEPRLLNPADVPDFFNAVGKNTEYITHPAETLADTFYLLVSGKEGLPNPEIVKGLSDWLDEAIAHAK